MSISEVKLLRLRRICVFLAVSVFCVIFRLVYDRFGHGVTSVYMTWLFLIPLIGGVAWNLLLLLLCRRGYSPWGDLLWNAGIAALSAGSALRGILEIAGTSSGFLPVFAVAGGALCLAGACASVRRMIGPEQKKGERDETSSG